MSIKPTIIGIAGGTASGKTTVALELYDNTKNYGSVLYLKMDDYYKKFQNIPINENGIKNFDHPDSYDIELLASDLKKLKQFQSIDKPLYDFVHSERLEETEHIEPAEVIIVEGIMTFAHPIIRNLLDIKIFVDTPDDIRFIRRLTRDIEDRGREMNSVINQYLTSVRPMHQAFVEPSKRFADIIIPEGAHNQVAMDVLCNQVKTLLKK